MEPCCIPTRQGDRRLVVFARGFSSIKNVWQHSAVGPRQGDIPECPPAWAREKGLRQTTNGGFRRNRTFLGAAPTGRNVPRPSILGTRLQPTQHTLSRQGRANVRSRRNHPFVKLAAGLVGAEPSTSFEAISHRSASYDLEPVPRVSTHRVAEGQHTPPQGLEHEWDI